MELNLKDRLKIFFGIIFNTFQKTIELIYHTTTVISSSVSSKIHFDKRNKLLMK